MANPCRDILERYLRARSATLDRVTLRLYRNHVGSLLEFLETRYPEVRSFEALARTPHIEEWLRALSEAEPPYTMNTRRQVLFGVRRFLADIREWGLVESLAPGLILAADFPPQECSPAPRRKLKSLAAELGTSPECLATDPWLELLERYLRTRSATHRRRSGVSHRVALLSLIRFLRRRFPEVASPGELKRSPHIEAWLQWLSEREPPYKESTRRGYAQLARRFFEDIRRWQWPESPPEELFGPDERVRAGRNSRWRTYLGTTSRADTPFDGVLKRYLGIRAAALRPATLSHYRVAVRSLTDLLAARYPEIDSFGQVRRSPHIEDWLRMLAEARPPYTRDTRRETIRNVWRFFDDISEWGWPSPPEELIFRDDFPPPEHHLPRPLAPEVDQRLMAALEADGDFVSLGLRLARRTGLRIGELQRLELDCVIEDPQRYSSLRVPLGKLRSERVIPIDPDTAELVRTIRAMRGDRPATVDPETGRPIELLFVRPGGEMLGRHLFARKLRQVAEAAGITENVHPHRLRHTYATDLLRGGVSLVGVMKLLGHKTLKMTLRYVEVTNEDLGREYLSAMENARHRYAGIKDVGRAKTDEAGDPLGAIKLLFDELVARVQKIRFDDSDSDRRARLQRFVERLRRAQSDLPGLLG